MRLMVSSDAPTSPVSTRERKPRSSPVVADNCRIPMLLASRIALIAGPCGFMPLTLRHGCRLCKPFGNRNRQSSATMRRAKVVKQPTVRRPDADQQVKIAKSAVDGCPLLPQMRHHEPVAYDYERLARAIRDARSRQRLTQDALAERAGVYVSTIQNLEGRRTPKQWPTSAGAIEAALGKPEGWARAIAEGREPPGAEDSGTPAMEQRRGLIDPDSPDPVIRELSIGPVAGGDEFREELIRLYLEDVAEGERLSRERAARRALRLAEKSRGPSAAEARVLKGLGLLETIEREIEAEDTAKNSDTAGQNRDLA